ncbi:MAG: helix-turn-helix transcriptional regulator [Trebonia sp.]
MDVVIGKARHAQGHDGPAPMRGRDTEQGLIRQMLERAARGQGSILLIDGELGAGKTSLLAAAGEAARADGFAVAASTASELATWAGGLPGRLAQLATWVRGLQGQLAELAAAGPALISLDDVHWADPATLHALRSMPGSLAAYPFAWVLARDTHGGDPAAGRLFDVLEHAGGTRTSLAPLTLEAQAAVMRDVLGGTPDQDLADSAACAAGNPLMLTEFLRGLVDEGAISIAAGCARLLSPVVPERFRAVVRKRLGTLAARTKYLLEAGSVLGRSFRLEDAAEMLDLLPGALLAEVDEALAARIIVADRDSIAFRHELVWQAVADTLPRPVARALHRQAGQMLLAHGEDTLAAGRHLVAGAHRGDAVALAGLDRAVAEAAQSSPTAAAELAIRALDLTGPTDPGRYARTVAAIRALTAAGRWEDAEAAALPALLQSAPEPGGPELRSALASLHAMHDRGAEALIEAESILADPALAEEAREDAKIALMQALTGRRNVQRAAQVAKAIAAEPRAQHPRAAVPALLTLAVAEWDAAHVGEALDLAAEAVRAQASEPRAPRFHPGLFLAARLTDIHRFADAEAIMDSIGPADTPPVLSWTPASADILRARAALARGRIDDAAAKAELALGHASVTGTLLHDQLARSLLAAVALRRRDLPTADGLVSRPPVPPRHFMSGYEASRSLVVAAQVEEARNGPHAALDRLGDLYADLLAHRYPLVSDPVCGAWLVRVALAAGDSEGAATVAGVLAEVSRANPGMPLFRACADHAAGILEGDHARLERAVTLHDDPWARASAAEDLGALVADSRRKSAVSWLDMALDAYVASGAERDGARIRLKLRRLGVRRRHWHAITRPETGWESLTQTERSVAGLVATGLTNQQVADQMFISTHTVAFHLRQVFRKLSIRSRVELARAAPERPG